MKFDKKYKYKTTWLNLDITAITGGSLILNPHRAGINFRRQNLTSKVDTRSGRVKIFNIGIQMRQKELTKTFMMF